ncbi:MarR family winged helix-turn-helix transcriptional regulator [Elongatibacter sediminis]|uniref:MarR family winged helix-turn-helix transcriptional regulator n=1 Tax=Elongatibacter sediminis TaxID=3119006 RepID=A0AAW9RAI7_9GAMM
MTAKSKPAPIPEPGDNDLQFGDLDEMLGIVLQRTFIATARYFKEYMGDDFRPGFFTTLSLIEKNPGLTQKALAAAIRRDTSTLVPFLNKLEELGWAERRRSQADKRAHELYLTPAGHRQAARFDTKVRALEARLAEELGSRQAQQLRRLLRELDDVFARLSSQAD